MGGERDTEQIVPFPCHTHTHLPCQHGALHSSDLLALVLRSLCPEHVRRKVKADLAYPAEAPLCSVRPDQLLHGVHGCKICALWVHAQTQIQLRESVKGWKNQG